MIHFDEKTIGQYTIGRVVVNNDQNCITSRKIGHITGFILNPQNEICLTIRWAIQNSQYNVDNIKPVLSNETVIHPTNVTLLDNVNLL